jgi:hypothetical protein
MRTRVLVPASMTRFFVSLLLVLGYGSLAAGQDASPARFSDRGRVMVGGDIGGRWSNDDANAPWPTYSAWSVYGWPSLTYFLADRVGLGFFGGGGVSGGRMTTCCVRAQYRTSQVLVGPRAVLEVPLGPRAGLLFVPLLGYGFERRKIVDWSHMGFFGASAQGASFQQQSPLLHPADSLKYKAHYLRAGLSIPLVFSVSSSVAIGFGPDAWVDVFVKQDPDREYVTRDGPGVSPGLSDGPVTEERAYPRTRMQFGASTWIGASF